MKPSNSSAPLSKEKKIASQKKPYVIANWKMNKTALEASEYVQELLPLISHSDSVNIWLSVPFTALHSVRELLKDSSCLFGAQNMNDASSGAFTGEIAGVMLKEAGCHFVILGHSERRRYFHETDEYINKKVVRAIEVDLIPVLCIGETMEERENGKTDEILSNQISQGLQGLSSQQIQRVIVAYEPVWAIGTGKSATEEIVQDAHAKIRKSLQALVGDGAESAERIPILYGGSVNEGNAHALISLQNVDGFLVGTASLQPATFANIVEAVVR